MSASISGDRHPNRAEISRILAEMSVRSVNSECPVWVDFCLSKVYQLTGSSQAGTRL